MVYVALSPHTFHLIVEGSTSWGYVIGFFCVWHLWIDGWENNSNNQFSLSWEIARRVRKVFFFNQKNPFFGLRHPSLSCHSKQVVVGRKIEFFMCCCRILKSFHYIVLVLVKGEKKSFLHSACFVKNYITFYEIHKFS